MKQYSFICDSCRQPIQERADKREPTIHICTGSQPDAAGGAESVGVAMDLCYDCLSNLVRKYFTSINHTTYQQRLDFVRMAGYKPR